MGNTPVVSKLQSVEWVCVLDASGTSHQTIVFLCCPAATLPLEASQIEPNCLLKWSIPRHVPNANHCVPYSRLRSTPRRWLWCCVVDSSTSDVWWSNPGILDAIESKKCSPSIEHDASALKGKDLVVRMFLRATQLHATFVWEDDWEWAFQYPNLINLRVKEDDN